MATEMDTNRNVEISTSNTTGDVGGRNRLLSTDDTLDNIREHQPQPTTVNNTRTSSSEDEGAAQQDNWDTILQRRIEDNESVISFDLDDPLFAVSPSTVLSPTYSPAENNQNNQIDITVNAIDEACKAALDHLKRLNSEGSDEQDLESDPTYVPQEDEGAESDSTEHGAESDYYKDIDSEDEPEKQPVADEQPLLDFTSILNKPQHSSKAVQPSTSTGGNIEKPSTAGVRRFKVDPTYKAPDINSELLQIVLTVLTTLGIAKPDIFVTGWPSHRFRAVANFKEACSSFKIPLVLGQEQISAFLEHLQDKNYVLATLQKNWATIKVLAEELKVEITHEMKIHYNYVMDHCKQITEGRLPVTTLLLTQLITAADEVLSGYNALLAKSMFICAFAFSMRVGEYTCNPGKKRGTFYREHNVLANSIKIATDRLTITFQSDKTFRTARSFKHRDLEWSKLPQGSKEILEQYVQSRPDAKHFFCRQDGRSVIRQFFVDLLDVCLLQTDWAPMTLTPHSFRQGRLCQGLFDGEDLMKLIRDGRWSMSSAAVEHYTRTSFAALSPQEIVQQCPEFHREWTPKRLAFLSENMVESGGQAENHPHTRALQKWCPLQFRQIGRALPSRYPCQFAAARMQKEVTDRESRIYLKKQVQERERIRQEFAKKQLTAEKIRRGSLAERYNLSKTTPATTTMEALPGRSAAKQMAENEVQTTFEYVTEVPQLVYKGQLVPVHTDALDLIPQSNVFKLVQSKRIMLKRFSDDEVNKSSAPAKRMKQKVMDAIMARLAPEK